MNNNDNASQSILKAGAGQAARLGLKLGGAVINSIGGLLAPILWPLALLLVLFLIVYTILFLFPKFMMDNKPPTSTGDKVVSIFNLGEQDDWTESMDQELAAKYRELEELTWKNGFKGKEELKEGANHYLASYIENGDIPNEQDQAYPHRLPWSVLAGIDRITGDPITHGGNVRMPNPEEHFNALKPTYTWTDFQVTVVKRESHYDKETKKTYYTYHTYTMTIKLLETAKTFEADYVYHWKEKVRYYNDGHLKSILPDVESVEKNGPFLQPLIDLLTSYGITDDLEIETVLELAELYDEDYQIDAGILGARVEGFQIDLSQQYFIGIKGTASLPVPAQYFNITSPFGRRVHPITKTVKMHTGIDIGAPSGAPVFSAFNGVIIWSGQLGGYGTCIMVDHGDIITLYGHLSAITKARGTEVSAGDTIGLVGSTGMSTGPHLHFEVRKKLSGGNIKFEDPLPYLNH